MSGQFQAAAGYYPDPDDNVMDSIFKQYERVIVESIITSFGLDFIVGDRYGGDVDTIHNVRLIGKDPDMRYKNRQNERDYAEHHTYDRSISVQYHQDRRYIEKNRDISRQKQEGTLKDSYTGQTIKRNEQTNLDHVVSAKEIHEDKGRILAGVDGRSLANSDINLKATKGSINKSKGASSASEFAERLRSESGQRQKRITELKEKDSLSDKERKELSKLEDLQSVKEKELLEADAKARKEINAKISTAYYTSPKFAKDTALAAGKVGVKMGVRQALGFVFTEIWFAVKEEFVKIKGTFRLDEFCAAISEGIKRGILNAKEKYKEVVEKLKEGMAAGVLSSLTTTLCNIFFSTAKNIVRIIRQSWASLVSAAKILFLNPDDLSFGERMRAVAKVLAAGASVIVGGLVSDAIGKTPIAAVPVIGEIVQTFCGTLVTGIMSCTLLYFLDRNKTVQKLVEMLNKIPTMSDDIRYFKAQAAKFEAYAAELMKIDLAQFKKEISVYADLANQLETARDEDELNRFLKDAIERMEIKLPWQGDFDSFMGNKNNALVFE